MSDDKKNDKNKIAILRQYASALILSIKGNEINSLKEKLCDIPKDSQLLLLDLFNLFSMCSYIASQDDATEEDKKQFDLIHATVSGVINPSSKVLYEAKDIPPVNVPFVQGVN